MANLKTANAYLRYDNKRFPLWVMQLAQPHELAGSLSQSKTFQHFYPRSYFPGALTITGRVRNQDMYNDLSEFIRGHHLALMADSPATNRPTSGKIPLMEFGFPDENMYVTGWVTPFTAGARRFNVAPEYTLTFTVASDRHSTNDRINPSFTTRGWWTGAFLDFDENGPVDPTPRRTPHSTPRDTNQYKWPESKPDPAQISAAPIIVQVVSGAGFAGGAAGAGGGNFNPDGTGVYDPADFQYGATLPAGHSLDQIHSAAIAAEPSGQWPMHIMNQGMVVDGKISIKYVPLFATGPGNTIWIPF
jgi:hypothetical protein